MGLRVAYLMGVEMLWNCMAGSGSGLCLQGIWRVRIASQKGEIEYIMAFGESPPFGEVESVTFGCLLLSGIAG